MVWEAIPDQSSSWKTHHSSLSPAAAAVIGIGATILTAGAGSTLVAPVIAAMEIEGTTAAATLTAAANATVSTLASQAAVSIVSNQGDLGKVASELASKDCLHSLAKSIVVAGSCAGLCSKLDINVGSAAKAQTVPDRIKQAMGWHRNCGQCQY